MPCAMNSVDFQLENACISKYLFPNPNIERPLKVALKAIVLLENLM